MTHRQADIRIVIHLRGEDGYINPKYLVQTFDNIEESLYASDRRDIELATKEIEISDLIRDACLERLRQFRHRRLVLVDAKSGSLEFVALVAGVSYWLLEKTLSQSITEGYKGSQTHERLKNYFRKKIDEKSLFITESIRRVFSSKRHEVIVKAVPAAPDQPNTIILEVGHKATDRPHERIKSLGDELE